MGRLVGFERHRGQRRSGRTARLLASGAALGGILGYASLNYAPSLPLPLAGGACNIKGNISMSTGERIYHMPGQEYYSETVISPGKGERWFCSEAEARAAGWRKSKV
jgi:hypothetical protein